jgi:hypothetical protein
MRTVDLGSSDAPVPVTMRSEASSLDLKCLKGITISEVAAEAEKARGTNPGKLKMKF